MLALTKRLRHKCWENATHGHKSTVLHWRMNAGRVRLAYAEFLASTHHSVQHAYNDLPTLEMILESQVNATKNTDVELFWWSY